MIYFIQQGAGSIKIGRSVDPKKRIQQMQTASPKRFRVVLIMRGGHEKEKELHERFASENERGEWFRGPTIAHDIEEWKYAWRNAWRFMRKYAQLLRDNLDDRNYGNASRYLEVLQERIKLIEAIDHGRRYWEEPFDVVQYVRETDPAQNGHDEAGHGFFVQGVQDS